MDYQHFGRIAACTTWFALVALLGTSYGVEPIDFLTITPINDGNLATDDRGRANTHINSVAFKNQALTTVAGYQFTSYYDLTGKLVIARRNLVSSPTEWSLLRTQFSPVNINDAHDTSVIAVDGDGYLHVAWGVHGNPLYYTRSTTPLINDLPMHVFGETQGNSGDLNAIPLQGANVTYPELYNVPGSGDLLLAYRTGSSGDGEYQLARWNNTADAWTSVRTAVNALDSASQQPWIDNDYSGDSLPDVNAYLNGLTYDAAGRLHVTWTWRTGGDSLTQFKDYQSNHNIMYAYSDNNGVDWYRQDGARYERNGAHDIDENNAQPVVALPEGSSLINQTSSAVGPDGTYYMATNYAPQAQQGYHVRQVMLVEYDGQQWSTHQVSNRQIENGGNRVPEGDLSDFNLRRPLVAVDEHNRVFLVYSDHQRGGVVTVAYSESLARDDWVTIDLTTDDMVRWDPKYDLNRWKNEGVLSLYYQPTFLDGTTASQVSILDWDARNYFASLQQATLGDFDHNGVVDGADYVVWRKGLGTKYTQNDYDSWRDNFGRTADGDAIASGSSLSVVPEPATNVALLTGMLAIFRRRRFGPR